MISKLDQQILSTLLNHLDRRLSINQIAQILKKSYPNIYNKTNELIDLKLLKKEKIGKATVCRLNIENDLLRNILSHMDIIKRDELMHDSPFLTKIAESLDSASPSIGIITAFSFEGMVGICIQKSESKAELESFLLSRLSKQDCSKIIIFDKKSLMNYVVPEIISKKIILSNPDNYYRLLSEIKSESLFD